MIQIEMYGIRDNALNRNTVGWTTNGVFIGFR